MSRFRLFVLLSLTAIYFSAHTSGNVLDELAFDRQIAPLLAQRCLNCHSGDETKGNLDLSSREKAMAGGESGPVIVPGNADESLLWQHVESDEMPPKKPLAAEDKVRIRAWIAGGAVWGTETIDPFRYTTDSRAGLDWWSLKPIQNSKPPAADDRLWNKNPIDAFVFARLKDAGLSPSPEADKQTLIRRLYFDLLGLPPTLEQINAYLNDSRDSAYDDLVDELLESPHYGERWARHWLDIVRFGESNGFEYDEPRNHFWPYRNWVIESLNQDMAYDEFVRQQLAGDILYPTDGLAITATGFLVAGPHNTTLPDNAKMKMSMAQDELEDLVGLVGQTFLGLTVNCSRCHDHKFDPISQKDYYQLAAALAGVTHGERTVLLPLNQDRTRMIDASLKALLQELDALQEPVRNKILAARKSGTTPLLPPPQARVVWEFHHDLSETLLGLTATAKGETRFERGALVVDGRSAYVETAALPFDIAEKTLEVLVQLDTLDQAGGAAISIQTLNGTVFDAIVFGEQQPKQWMAGSNSFLRTTPFGAAEETEAANRPVRFAIVYQQDGTISGYREGKPYGTPYRQGDLQLYPAGQSQLVFGLRHTPAGGNRMLSGRIHQALLYDRALTPQEVATAAGVAALNHITQDDLFDAMPALQRDNHRQMTAHINRLNQERQVLANQQPQVVYTCVSTNQGVTHILRRGDVGNPAEVVSPGGVSAVASDAFPEALAPNAPDAQRRTKLAAWVTDPHNPLLSRVMVNRLWLYHFGQGFVATPSDFGFNGGKPSHPELLDYLAHAFQSLGYRLKPMHRMMVTTAAYRQASTVREEALALDAENRLLWRKSPSRIEAEAIRDAVLVVTGQLNPTIGGQGYRDVEHFPFKGSNFYTSIAERGTEGYRRTIYRFTPRGGRNPFLDTFDCPDPSATTPKRATTITPLQSLALFNNDIVFTMADHFATSVKQTAGESIDKQIKQVYLRAFGREASLDDVQLGQTFLLTNDLAAFCRVILNSSEFIYVH